MVPNHEERHGMTITEIATIAQMLLDSTEKDKSNPNRPPMPRYVTAHAPSSTIQFMADSFAEVEKWAEYLEGEYEYWISVSEPGDMPHAFAKTLFRSCELIGGKDLTFTLEVFHNERLMPIPCVCDNIAYHGSRPECQIEDCNCPCSVCNY